ncbi:unnamed protein product [marine sediment metagenome]|uniref:Phage replisome organiser N-terminal domain-containing protein n=1 Tax=marine sediment metagenome TaxID=412755 RepID=X0SH42_9ZZZZ
MDRYSKIQSSLWDSKKFNKLNDFEKIVYMYLLTCPHGNSAGLFKLKEDYAVSDLRCTLQRYQKAVKKLCVELICIEDDIIFIRDFIKFNPYTSGKHVKGSLKFVVEFMDTSLYKLFYSDLCKYNPNHVEYFRKPIDTLSIPYDKPISDTGKAIPTDTNTDTNKDTITNTDIDTKHKHGEYNHVLLTDDQLSKLKIDFPDYEERITRLDEYLEMTPKPYKNHNLVIRNWAKKDKVKSNQGYVNPYTELLNSGALDE